MTRLPSFLTALVFFVTPALATSVQVTLDPGLLAGSPGDELTYSGTITATEDVFLNSVCFTFTATLCDSNNSPGLGFFTIDTNSFYLNVPGFFAAGDTYTGPVFSVQIDPLAVSGLYLGSVTLLGGADFFALDPASPSSQFQLVVTPEPATGGLVLLGAAFAAWARRKRETNA